MPRRIEATSVGIPFASREAPRRARLGTYVRCGADGRLSARIWRAEDPTLAAWSPLVRMGVAGTAICMGEGASTDSEDTSNQSALNAMQSTKSVFPSD